MKNDCEKADTSNHSPQHTSPCFSCHWRTPAQVQEALTHNIVNTLSAVECICCQYRDAYSDSDRTALEFAFDHIRDILRFTHNKPASVSLSDLHVTLDLVQRLALAKAVPLGIRFEMKCPSSPLPFVGQHVVLQQILMNLILNSVQATQSQPVRCVQLTCLADREGYWLVVQDTGPGMSHQALRTESTTRPTGHGIGLNFCRFHARHTFGGRLQFASRLTGGCEARLWLPRPSAVSVVQ